MTAKVRLWPWLALLLALSPALCGATPPLDANTLPRNKIRIGRIFFSPAERRHRHENKTPATDAPSAHTARAERLEINGAINSSTQGRAVWVNGTAIENSAKFKSAWTDPAGGVWLRDDRRAPRLVRPGQAMDPASGTVEDLLPAGSVARH